MNYINDLKFGENYERLFLESRKNVASYKKIDGLFKPFDLEITYKNNKVFKYEIKADRISHISGNIAIEFECNKQYSGIYTTEADYYVYYIIKNDKIVDVYKIPVEKIKKYIDKSKYFKTKYGGDRGKSQMYLFNKQVFEKYRKK